MKNNHCENCWQGNKEPCSNPDCSCHKESKKESSWELGSKPDIEVQEDMKKQTGVPGLNEAVRDLTTITPKPKSEVRRIIESLLDKTVIAERMKAKIKLREMAEYADKQKEDILEGFKYIAMVDNGKEPKYFVKDVLDLINKL